MRSVFHEQKQLRFTCTLELSKETGLMRGIGSCARSNMKPDSVIWNSKCLLALEHLLKKNLCGPRDTTDWELHCSGMENVLETNLRVNTFINLRAMYAQAFMRKRLKPAFMDRETACISSTSPIYCKLVLCVRIY